MRKLRTSRISTVALGLFLSAAAWAAPSPIDVTIDSTANISGNGAIEACGTAKAKGPASALPIQVVLQHSDSTYTTLAAPNGKWCILYKRWTFDGQIAVGAQYLGQSAHLSKLAVATVPAESESR